MFINYLMIKDKKACFNTCDDTDTTSFFRLVSMFLDLEVGRTGAIELSEQSLTNNREE